MNSYSYDLHIHSCLSPCGDNSMTPAAIAGIAALNGLEIAALTDHSTAKNCPAFIKAAEFYGVCGIAGMELTTAEEVHVVCLFSSLDSAMDFDAYVHDRLPEVDNNERIFGEQLVCDEDDNILSHEPYLLINATSITFDEVYNLVDERGGVMIPAHLDKSTTSLISNLGFIPPDSRFVCAEIKNAAKVSDLIAAHPYLDSCRILTSSDAHYPGDIAQRANFLHAEECTPAAVISALRRGKVSE